MQYFLSLVKVGGLLAQHLELELLWVLQLNGPTEGPPEAHEYTWHPTYLLVKLDSLSSRWGRKGTLLIINIKANYEQEIVLSQTQVNR